MNPGQGRKASRTLTMLDKIKTTLQLARPELLHEQAYINGEWVSATDGGTFPVTNPADDTLLAEVAQAPDTFTPWLREILAHRQTALDTWIHAHCAD